jgi:hypothetical protein
MTYRRPLGASRLSSEHSFADLVRLIDVISSILGYHLGYALMNRGRMPLSRTRSIAQEEAARGRSRKSLRPTATNGHSPQLVAVSSGRVAKWPDS